MQIERASGPLPFSREQIFDLVADVERYPEFLHWWLAARITGRDADRLVVDQSLGFGPVRLDFKSAARLQRPERLEVSSTDPMFRQFHLTFFVDSKEPGGCILRIRAELEMRSMLRQFAVREFFGTSVEHIIAAFEARARQVYVPAPQA